MGPKERKFYNNSEYRYLPEDTRQTLIVLVKLVDAQNAKIRKLKEVKLSLNFGMSLENLFKNNSIIDLNQDSDLTDEAVENLGDIV